MKNVVIVASKTSNNHNDILNMPYITFLCYVHYLQELEYEAYKMQAEMFSFGSKSSNSSSPKHQTKPDLNKIRMLGGRI